MRSLTIIDDNPDRGQVVVIALTPRKLALQLSGRARRFTLTGRTRDRGDGVRVTEHYLHGPAADHVRAATATITDALR